MHMAQRDGIATNRGIRGAVDTFAGVSVDWLVCSPEEHYEATVLINVLHSCYRKWWIGCVYLCRVFTCICIAYISHLVENTFVGGSYVSPIYSRSGPQ